MVSADAVAVMSAAVNDESLFYVLWQLCISSIENVAASGKR